MSRPTPPPAPVPGLFERIGAVATAGEALIFASAAVAQVVEMAKGRAAEPSRATFLALFLAALAAGLVFVARGLWRGARWPRGAAMTWQVLQCAVASSFVKSEPLVAAVLLMPVPLVVVGVIAGSLRTERASREAR